MTIIKEIVRLQDCKCFLACIMNICMYYKYICTLLTDFFLTHSGLKRPKKCKQIILKVRICVGQYPTQLTVTLQNCRKFWSNIFVTFLVVFALFFANSTTVMVALVAKATRATITVVSFAKNSAKTTRNVT